MLADSSVAISMTRTTPILLNPKPLQLLMLKDQKVNIWLDKVKNVRGR